VVKELHGYTDEHGTTHVTEEREVVDVLYKKDYNSVVPTQGYENDFAYDMYANEGVLVPPLTFKSRQVSTGFKTAFDPTDMGMKINLRSGAAANTPLILSNGTGIIEGTYRDGLKILVRNTFIDNRLLHFAFTVKGERIAIKDIPKSVMQKAKELFDAETKLLGYDKSTSKLEKELFVTMVPAGTIYIAEGDRIAQMHFVKKVFAKFIEATGDLPDSVRGEGGLGSSGSTLKEQKDGEQK
jgi:dUTPase